MKQQTQRKKIRGNEMMKRSTLLKNLSDETFSASSLATLYKF
jgi:hypothetical protein